MLFVEGYASLARICTDLLGFTRAGKRRRTIERGKWAKSRSQQASLSRPPIGNCSSVNCLAFIEGIPPLGLSPIPRLGDSHGGGTVRFLSQASNDRARTKIG